MTDRYWHDDIPQGIEDLLLDWVNKNVVAALHDSWGRDRSIDIGNKNGRAVLYLIGSDKPTDEDPTGQKRCFLIQSDLLESVEEYLNVYTFMGGPKSQAQIDDVKERVSLMLKTSKDIADIAERFSQP